MAKQAALAMKGLLPNAEDTERPTRFNALLTMLRNIELSADDAAEVLQEVAAPPGEFQPQEIRQLQLATQPHLQMEDQEAQGFLRKRIGGNLRISAAWTSGCQGISGRNYLRLQVSVRRRTACARLPLAWAADCRMLTQWVTGFPCCPF